MRVFRTILGMLLLTIGLPALLAGGGLWAVMQHRDPGGAFTGELQRLTVPGYAVVVPDIDRLLRDDVPFARMTGTQMRLSAATADGPAFLGIAPSDTVARYLAGVPYNRVDAVDLGTGILPVTAVRSGGRRTPDGVPARQTFWTASGAGLLAFNPADLGDRPHSLVLMNPGGTPVARLATVAEVRPGWLNSGTWGLLTLGTLLVMAGVIVLSWPGRRREVVYVVEPSQVPELMHAIGAPLPLPGGLAYHAGARGGAHRPRTLADSRPSRPPALPQFAWPPKRPAGPFPPAFTATLDGPEPASGPVAAPGSPAASGPHLHGDAASGSLVPDDPGVVSDAAASVDALPGPGFPGDGGAPVPGSLGDGGASGQASPGDGGASGPGSPGDGGASVPGGGTPAPGQPLSLLGDTPALAGSQPGTVPARRGDRRRSPSSPDAPGFQATAVGAWVAATAPDRARKTEARAAARLAEAARRNAGKFTPAQTGKTNMPGSTIPIAPRRGHTTANPEEAPTTGTPAVTGSVAEESATPITVEDVAGEPETRPADAGNPDAPAEESAPVIAVEDVAGKPETRSTEADKSDTPAVIGSVAEESAAPAKPATQASDAVGGLTEKHDATADRATTPPKTPTQRPGAAALQTPDQGRPTAKLTATSPDPVRPDDGPSTADGPAPRPAMTRVALRTGPAATDWTATGLTRLEPRRVPAPEPVTVIGEAADRPDQTGTVESNKPPVNEPAANLTVKPGAHGSAPAVTEPGPQPSPPGDTPAEPEAKATTTEKEEPGKRPIIPFPSRPAPTDDREEAAPAGGEQRASIHAVEAGIPVLDQAAPPETVESGAAPTPSVADSTHVEASDSVPATTDPDHGKAGLSEPQQPPTRPGRSKRASMHAVEAGGLTLSKKPAPVPTQGLAAPSRPVSESPVSESPVSERPASGRTSEPAPEHAATAATPNGEPAGSVTEPASGHAATAENDEPAERNASSGPVKATAKTAGSGATRDTAEGVKTPKARGDRPRTAEPGGDNPLARAQSRIAGDMPAAPRPAPATRRTPASWVRAAESVAARTGVEAPDGTAQPVPPKARTAGTRTAGVPEPEPKAAGTRAAEPSKPEPEPKAAGVPEPEPKAAGTRAAEPSKPEPEPKTAGVPKPEPKAAGTRPAGDPKPKAFGGLPLSYREEAAKLLAGGSDQRRRRSPAARNRPKDGDEKN
ncbi:hypothetical protein [Actinoplanes lobatus]|uniref:Uncharacterized protein n=1 Tax=Actinoplanes lobatus TaxID=113568 RepID=A0ABQ4A8F1_9ACTN|nr:hypothetical protein [Actinoplanes lobatus]GIE37268.1 hypothetical protein Alo02nite_01660 [Actinoplanes lobatus]